MEKPKFQILKLFLHDFNEYINVFLWKSPFRIFIISIVAFCCYGQHLFYNTCNNDFCWYINSSLTTMLHQKRWGRSLLGCIGLLDRDVPLWGDFLGLILLICAGILFTFIFYKLSEGAFSSNERLVFLLLFLSFPLTYSLTVFPTLVFELGICYTITALAFIAGIYYKKIKDNASIALAIALLAIVFATYESFVLVFILCCEFYILWLLLVGKLSSWKQIYSYLKTLIIIVLSAIAIYFIVVSIISIWVHYPSDGGGAHKQILWLSQNNKINGIIHCITKILYKYIYVGIFHFAIFSFDISFLIFLTFPLLSKENRGKVFFFLLIITSTLFAFSILQGYVQLYRTCQTFPLFIGLVWMFSFCLRKGNKRLSYIFVFLIVLFQMKELCLMQNAERITSEKSYHDMIKAGYDIKSTGYAEKKAVIVLGRNYQDDYDIKVTMSYPLFFSIPRLEKKPIWETVGRDVLADGGSSNRNFQLVFKYFTNIEIKLLSYTEENRLAQAAIEEKMPCFPEEGYIKDCGDYLLVNMGTRNTQKDTTMSFGGKQHVKEYIKK